MIVTHSLEDKEFKNWQSVITIGSFDGVHKGHWTILNTILRLAQECDCKTVVITFDPIPKYFSSNGKVKLITTLEEKLQIVNKLKVDGVVVIPFDEKFSEIEPVHFLDMVWNNLRPYAITVGYNHHFGRKGEGNISLLKEFSIKKHIKLITVDEVTIDKMDVSSTVIRKFIKDGKIEEANRLLGRNFFFSASVLKGAAVGRTLSYPTANLRINSEKKILPKEGVYAAQVLVDGQLYGAMLYIGTRPTFYESSPITCEVYIMGFEGNIYDKEVTVYVLKRIRDEKKFNTSQNLIKQINSDEIIAKQIIDNALLKEGG